jgi:hypothetical protein
MFKYYKIYYTDQVTNPIRKWNSIKVSANEMPYKLKLDKTTGSISKRNTDNLANTDSGSSSEQGYFLRISAVNSESGEGPYSNIIELKKINNSMFFVVFYIGLVNC